jgi:hypothetical protein
MTDSVEETLAKAAQASEAAAQAVPKKERVKKTTSGEAGAAKEPKAPREKKEKAPAKQYPQANEDGTPALNEDGTPVMGAYKTRYKEPKAAKAPRQSGKYPASGVITLLAETNPKREGSASRERFAHYKTGQTVAEALELGLTHGDFNHDVTHGFISIEVGEEKAAE